MALLAWARAAAREAVRRGARVRPGQSLGHLGPPTSRTCHLRGYSSQSATASREHALDASDRSDSGAAAALARLQAETGELPLSAGQSTTTLGVGELSTPSKSEAFATGNDSRAQQAGGKLDTNAAELVEATPSSTSSEAHSSVGATETPMSEADSLGRVRAAVDSALSLTNSSDLVQTMDALCISPAVAASRTPLVTLRAAAVSQCILAGRFHHALALATAWSGNEEHAEALIGLLDLVCQHDSQASSHDLKRLASFCRFVAVPLNELGTRESSFLAQATGPFVSAVFDRRIESVVTHEVISVSSQSNFQVLPATVAALTHAVLAEFLRRNRFDDAKSFFDSVFPFRQSPALDPTLLMVSHYVKAQDSTAAFNLLSRASPLARDLSPLEELRFYTAALSIFCADSAAASLASPILDFIKEASERRGPAGSEAAKALLDQDTELALHLQQALHHLALFHLDRGNASDATHVFALAISLGVEPSASLSKRMLEEVHAKAAGSLLDGFSQFASLYPSACSGHALEILLFEFLRPLQPAVGSIGSHIQSVTTATEGLGSSGESSAQHNAEDAKFARVTLDLLDACARQGIPIPPAPAASVLKHASSALESALQAARQNSSPSTSSKPYEPRSKDLDHLPSSSATTDPSSAKPSEPSSAKPSEPSSLSQPPIERRADSPSIPTASDRPAASSVVSSASLAEVWGEDVSILLGQCIRLQRYIHVSPPTHLCRSVDFVQTEAESLRSLISAVSRHPWPKEVKLLFARQAALEESSILEEDRPIVGFAWITYAACASLGDNGFRLAVNCGKALRLLSPHKPTSADVLILASLAGFEAGKATARGDCTKRESDGYPSMLAGKFWETARFHLDKYMRWGRRSRSVDAYIISRWQQISRGARIPILIANSRKADASHRFPGWGMLPVTHEASSKADTDDAAARRSKTDEPASTSRSAGPLDSKRAAARSPSALDRGEKVALNTPGQIPVAVDPPSDYVGLRFVLDELLKESDKSTSPQAKLLIQACGHLDRMCALGNRPPALLFTAVLGRVHHFLMDYRAVDAQSHASLLDAVRRLYACYVRSGSRSALSRKDESDVFFYSTMIACAAQDFGFCNHVMREAFRDSVPFGPLKLESLIEALLLSVPPAPQLPGNHSQRGWTDGPGPYYVSEPGVSLAIEALPQPLLLARDLFLYTVEDHKVVPRAASLNIILLYMANYAGARDATNFLQQAIGSSSVSLSLANSRSPAFQGLTGAQPSILPRRPKNDDERTRSLTVDEDQLCAVGRELIIFPSTCAALVTAHLREGNWEVADLFYQIGLGQYAPRPRFGEEDAKAAADLQSRPNSPTTALIPVSNVVKPGLAPPAALFHPVITAVAHYSLDLTKVFRILREHMPMCGLSPTLRTYERVLDACIVSRDLEASIHVLEMMMNMWLRCQSPSAMSKAPRRRHADSNLASVDFQPVATPEGIPDWCWPHVQSLCLETRDWRGCMQLLHLKISSRQHLTMQDHDWVRAVGYAAGVSESEESLQVLAYIAGRIQDGTSL